MLLHFTHPRKKYFKCFYNCTSSDFIEMLSKGHFETSPFSLKHKESFTRHVNFPDVSADVQYVVLELTGMS